MPDFQIKKTQKDYDVCIVGSGAGGGMAGAAAADGLGLPGAVEGFYRLAYSMTSKDIPR